MDRWVGKVALVTGASSGIGAAIAQELAKAGMVTIGAARRVERIEALKDDLPAEAASRLHAIRCDITREEDILSVFKYAEETFGGVDVLINNAGIGRPNVQLTTPNNTQALRDVLDTNVMGLVICTREAFNSMVKRSVAGHIVHINSVAGHTVLDVPSINIYGASKYAVTALTGAMRHEFRHAGTKVKVTSISPGLVRTEIIEGFDQLKDNPILEAKDIADGVLYVLGTPPHVQVHELTIKPVGEPF